jgi:hypothetical protein
MVRGYAVRPVGTSNVGPGRRYRTAGRVGTNARRTTVTEQSSLDRDELPLPDYDHLTLGELPTRIGGLDAEALRQLLAYEREHGDRLPVVQVLEHRLAAVESGAGVTGGNRLASTPASRQSPEGGSKVGPETIGPPVNPPSHGDPTNPAQPRG